MSTAGPTTPRVHVVGSINVDDVYQLDALPRPGETVLSRSARRTLGGKGANQAAACARLGAPTGFTGAVGDDEAGAFALQRLAEAGVEVGDVLRLDAPTGTALVFLDAEGENQIVVHPGANHALTGALTGALVGAAGGAGGEAASRLRAACAGADVVLCQLEIEDAVLAAVLEAVAETDVLFAVNAAPARPLGAAVVARADLVVVNDLEYAALPELAEARRVVVTSGGEGARMIVDGEVTARVPAVPTEVVSTVGAGDAFTAAVVVAIAGGADDETALRAASLVGAETVASPEAQAPLGRIGGYVGRVAGG